jgi:hypothetical protein
MCRHRSQLLEFCVELECAPVARGLFSRPTAVRRVSQVFVPGANLSMGDMHFSQGDGEVSFCGAIEMSGFLEIRTTVIKGGMKLLPVVRNLAFARRVGCMLTLFPIRA